MKTSRLTPLPHPCRFTFLAAALLVANVFSSLAQDSAPAKLCVMSFNLRYASSQPPNAWPVRRPLVKEVIATVSPDLIGTQEGLYQQLKDVAADLPDYAWLGTGRDGGSRGEFMAIFYKRTAFEPLEFDHFWLSDTPTVIGSSTWGNSNRRMVTWIKFRQLASGKEFYFFNTHFDHQVQAAREKSAALVRERIEALKTPLPLLLVGDFNAVAETNKAYHVLTEDGFLADTWKLAKERVNEGIATFNSFQGPQRNRGRIDWILARGNVSADKAEIVTFERNGQTPSDHYPIVAWLQIGGAK